MSTDKGMRQKVICKYPNLFYVINYLPLVLTKSEMDMDLHRLDRLILGLVLILLLFSAGCRRTCYQCYEFNGNLMVTKGGVTFYVQPLTRIGLQDSINRYISLGYTIDSVWDNGYFRDRPNSGVDRCDGEEFGTPPQFDSCIAVKGY